MKNNWLFGGLILLISISASCKKDNANPDSVLEHTITVPTIIGISDIDPNRKGFIDLYDGKTFSQLEANTNSSKIDFAL